MANVKILSLPPATSVLNTDEFPINQSGTTKKITTLTLTNSIETIIINNNNPNGLLKKPSPVTEGQILKYTGGQWVAANENSRSTITANTIDTGQRIAKARFRSSTITSRSGVPTSLIENVNIDRYLKVIATRIGNNEYVTIDYSNLPAKYKDPANPFFVENQYVGVCLRPINQGLLNNDIYKIQQHNPIANTFVIETFGTNIPFSKEVLLTLVLDNVDGTNQSAYNVKSIYIKEKQGYVTSSSIRNNQNYTFYVNFKEDVITKSKTNTTPIEMDNMIADGSVTKLLGDNAHIIKKRKDTKIDKYLPTGYGATSMGIHLAMEADYFNENMTWQVQNVSFVISI